MATGNKPFFRFSLFAIPYTAIIHKATFRAYVQTTSVETGHDTTVDVTMCRLNATWAEMGVTWNNRPSCVSPYTTIPVGIGGYSWNAFNLVIGWLDDVYPNYGLGLVGGPMTYDWYKLLALLQGSRGNTGHS